MSLAKHRWPEVFHEGVLLSLVLTFTFFMGTIEVLEYYQLCLGRVPTVDTDHLVVASGDHFL